MSATTAGNKLRGVNLGSWLLLEKWMVPSLFEGLQATDETTWCAELGSAAPERLRAHWNSFVTREDFAWIAEHGLNAVRIPVGHWIFGPDYPSHPKYGASRHPFVTGGIDVLDRAMDWAAEFGLRVMLDLHAAPGCQNGFDNGGIKDVCEWHTKEEYFEHSVDVLGRLAERYRAHPALYAIEVLNEPRWDVPTDYLKRYYLAAYQRIRQHCPAERVAVVFHDGFRSYREFLGFMQPPTWQNVIFDYHRYQCFERRDIDSDIYQHMHKAGGEWRDEADSINAALGLPAICGEWSLGLDLKVVSLWAEGPYNHALEGMDDFQQDVASRGYAAAQLLAFEKLLGWFFWSYKTETTPAWCLRECVARGWLPSRFR
ncbi:glycoside hydrolase family 5 protein [Thauera sp. CAU 1555]|uniref:Exo-1,3-beta-glucanase D n=1 Tax=Thauera sedimentorum TaxID=2767595 RepID=A0ABR9B5Y9_9RHOO|nr:glycoside hydrolase family 5 protein [Thauera sedimentorum]MBC9070878.1 glycoside hydrolase family 5 protein [Thauera sedimentorum]MBD8501797.1 glycoside hydrolase family 5 protein [Thauera sedimentorum]